VTEPVDDEAVEVLLDLLAGRARAQAVSTAAALGLADHLDEGPRDVTDLARELRCDAERLHRLMAFLAGLGLLERADPERFVLTTRGRALRADALGPLAAYLGSPESWDPWSRLREGLGAGPTAFERAFGAGYYELMARSPEAARRYDAAIDAYTRHEARALSERFDFSGVERVVDLGGGRGTTLVELLARWPHLRGVLVDLPHVADRTRERFAGVHGGRMEVVGGDFMREVPGGADVYLLEHVLHNWDDERARALLLRCADGMTDGGRLLVVEAILTPDERVDTARMLDLEMLVLTGGRERRKPELRRLLHDAGLALERVDALTPESWLLVARRRG